MVIKNKQTKKEYPISKEKWENFSQSVKNLFTVIDSAELKNPESQPISNLLERKEPQRAKPQAPSTGNKEGKSKNTKT